MYVAFYRLIDQRISTILYSNFPSKLELSHIGIASNLDPPQMPAAEEDSKSSSLVPMPHHVGKTGLSDVEKTSESDEDQFKRPVNGYKWILCCVGLYLGAILVGKQFRTVFITANATDNPP